MMLIASLTIGVVCLIAIYALFDTWRETRKVCKEHEERETANGPK